MYDYIQGILAKISPTQVSIDVGGVGYKISIPARALSSLPNQGEKVLLYISVVTREFSQTLYGFISEEERDVFEVLLNVSGVGPKTALSMIGHLTLDHLHSAVQNNEVALIAKVPGIGKKTAERLILELRDKLPSFAPSASFPFSVGGPVDKKKQTIQDAMSALINLGYNQQVAQKALKRVIQNPEEEDDLPAVISRALRVI